jgi:parallel beta-helix repeat protein
MKTLNIRKLIVALTFVMIGITSSYSQYILTVTNTNDPDPFVYALNPDDPEVVGTLQWAIRKANELGVPCLIVFDIPGGGQQFIYLNYDLPFITNQITIDGTTQTGYQTNQPMVVIDGQNKISTAIQINNQNACIIKGLHLRNCTYHGIVLYNCTNSEISESIINEIQGEGSNASMGLRLMSSSNIIVKGNIIGTDYTLTPDLGIGSYGIYNELDGSNNIIGSNAINEGNIIAFNGVRGIWLASGNGNKISGNKIINNPVGIFLSSGVNNNKSAPIITAYNPDGTITGTSQSNDIIEIFGSAGNENANEYLTSTSADANGNWSTIVNSSWDYVVATATDINNNTSCFSVASEKEEEYCKFNLISHHCPGDTVYIFPTDPNDSESRIPNCEEIGPMGAVCNYWTIEQNGNILYTYQAEWLLLDIYGTSYTTSFGFVPLLCMKTYETLFEGFIIPDDWNGEYIITAYTDAQLTNIRDNDTIYVSQFIIDLGDDKTICSGNSATLSVLENNATYLWSNGDTTQSITVSPTTTTIYCVTVTSQYGCVSNDCININLINGITINAVSPTFCANTSNHIGNAITVNGGSGNYSYQWSPATYLDNATNANPLCTVATSTLFNVTVTDNVTGCSNTTTFWVYTTPVPDVTITGDNTVCSDESITLSVSSSWLPSPPAPGLTYLWSTTETTQSITASPNVTTTYSVTVTTANSPFCTNTDSHTVTVIPTPVVSITGDASVCQGGTATLNASAGFVSYAWSTGSTTQQIVVTSPGTYSVTVTNANNCTATTSFYVSTYNVNVTITPSNPEVCLGNPLILTATGGATYLWSNGATGSAITEYPTSNTMYSVTATDVNGCIGDDKVNVTVIPVPTIFLESTNAICDNNGTATVSSVFGNPPFSYMWSNGSPSQSITGLSAGVYTVTVTDAGSCSVVKSITITYDCCNLDCNIFLEDGDDATDLMAQNGGSTFVSGKKVCINGTFNVKINIDTQIPITFNNCRVKMGDNAKIEVFKGSVLTIDNTIVKACNNKLWNMISVANGDAKVIVQNNSIISDGKDAIMSVNGGQFIIDKSAFKKNINAIHVKNWITDFQPGTINKTTFTGGTLINQLVAQKGVFFEKGKYFTFGNQNKFENLKTGIYARELISIISTYSTDFKYNSVSVDYQNTALYNAGSVLKLKNSKIMNCGYGVIAKNVKKLIEITNNQFNTITNNAIDITDNGICTIADNLQMNKIAGTAIKVQSTGYNSINQAIYNNVITNTRNGIQAVSLQGTKIFNNNITIKSQPAAVSDNNGVSVESCKGVNVEGNTITGDNIWHWWQRGVSSQLSAKTLIKDNIINTTGKSVEFGGTSINGKIQCNTFNNFGNGIFLAYCDNLPPQGDPATHEVYDNQWLGTVGEGHTHCYYSQGFNSMFYVRGDEGPLSAYVPWDYEVTPEGYPGDATPIPYTLDPDYYSVCSSAKSVTVSSYEFERQVAANEVEYNVFPVANQWLAKYYVYSRINDEPQMLDADPVFATFYDSVSTSSMGKIYEFNKLVSDTALDTLQLLSLKQLNNSIVANNLLEQNHKQVNDILLYYNENDSILPAQYNELVNIAMQCPYESGNAVYSSRVLLSQFDSTAYQNICETNLFAQNSDKSLTDNQYIKSSDYMFSYPQPVKDQLILEYSENYVGSDLKIFNILGEEIINVNLTNNEKSVINLSVYKSGIYFYTVIKEGKLLFSNKIVISN